MGERDTASFERPLNHTSSRGGGRKEFRRKERHTLPEGGGEEKGSPTSRRRIKKHKKKVPGSELP